MERVLLEVTVTEQTVPKKTRWGTVEKTLNQHIVHVRNADTGKMVHAGYVGTTSFLPVSGFPNEMVDQVAKACSEQLGREVLATPAPPTLDQVAAMIATAKEDDDE